MLLKWTRDTYGRYLSNPASDPVMAALPARQRADRIKRNKMVSSLLGSSRPFVIERTALDLVSSLDFDLKTAENLGPLLLEAPLPFPALWIEYEEDHEGEDGKMMREEAGVLIRQSGSRVFACSFHRIPGDIFGEPLVFISAEAGGKLEIVLNPHTTPILIQRMEGSREDRVSQLSLEGMARTAWAIRTVISASHLIATRNGPLDTAEEPLMSRPERRKLERNGELEKGAAPTVTRIRINDKGRLHLQAIEDEEGGAGGVRRRAHRVRGHFMRSAKGLSWRNAHIRGFGLLNETVRNIDAGPT